MLRDIRFQILSAILVVVAIVHVLGTYYYWYIAVPWIDIPLHFLGGVWIGGMAVWLYPKIYPHTFHAITLSVFRRRRNKSTKGVGVYEAKISNSTIYAIAFVSAFIIGIGWEVFEVMIFEDLMNEPNYWRDTISDLILDSAGGLSIAYIFQRISKS